MLEIDPANCSEDVRRLNPELGQASSTVVTKPRKYRNIPTEYKGRRYDSAKEATRARDLDLMVKAGEIAAWYAQVPFPLAGGIVYVADFVILHFDNTYTVEDAKSPATRRIPTYRLKRKLFKERYRWEIVEV